MRRLARTSLLLTLAVGAGAANSSCFLLMMMPPFADGSPRWQEDVFGDVTFDDVFVVTEAQLDRDFEIARADRQAGAVETAWDYGSLSPQNRFVQRERVVAEIEAQDEGVELRLRVKRQVKERRGLLHDEEGSEDDWSDGRDDEERAAVLFERIRAVFVTLRPSEQFYERRVPGGAGSDVPPDGGAGGR